MSGRSDTEKIFTDDVLGSLSSGSGECACEKSQRSQNRQSSSASRAGPAAERAVRRRPIHGQTIPALPDHQTQEGTGGAARERAGRREPGGPAEYGRDAGGGRGRVSFFATDRERRDAARRAADDIRGRPCRLVRDERRPRRAGKAAGRVGSGCNRSATRRGGFSGGFAGSLCRESGGRGERAGVCPGLVGVGLHAD